MRHSPRPSPLRLAAALLALTLSSCAAEPASAPTTEETASSRHGFVAGATENPEPQLQLAVVDDQGRVTLDDLLTGERIDLGGVGAGSVDDVASDGRMLAVTSNGDTTLVDSGSWTVDHGDHAHYYSAPARVLDRIRTGGATRIESSEKLTVLFTPATGTVRVLDRDALAQGRVDQVGRIDGEPHDGVAIPLGGAVVATVADAAERAGQVAVFDATGSVRGESIACADARGGALTRVGVVVGCEDGAVLAVEGKGGSIELERIPYPAGMDPATRAVSFAQRPGRPSVAAVAGAMGAWVLDTRARTWQLLPTETPLVTAVAADDERDLVVALDLLGRIVVITPETGETAVTEPLVSDPTRARVEVDPNRAYVNDPGGAVVHEVDYADSARVARSLPTALSSRFFAETGR